MLARDMGQQQQRENHESYYLHHRPHCRHPVHSRILGPKMNLALRFICALTAMLGGMISSGSAALADQVGNVDVDWLGNDIVIEAFADPKVDGVTCHVAYFERGLIDRLQKGNWFEDPSNSSIACRQTGDINIGDIDRSDEGESVFSERRSVIWKSLRVKRIFDADNQTLIYISHARDVQNGSAKMSISTVPLYQGQ